MQKTTSRQWIGILISAVAAAGFAALIIHVLTQPISLSRGTTTWHSSGLHGSWTFRETIFQLLASFIAASFVYHFTILPFIRSHNRRTIFVLNTLAGPIIAIGIFIGVLLLCAWIRPESVGAMWDLLVLLFTRPTQATEIVALLALYSIIAAICIVFTTTAALLAIKSKKPIINAQAAPDGKSAARGWIIIAVIMMPMLYVWLVDFKKGSDRAGCIMNIRNVQQATRSHNGMNNIGTGPAPGFSKHSLIGPGKFIDKEPVCPSGGNYTWIESGRAPEIGELMIRCSHPQHLPKDYHDW